MYTQNEINDLWKKEIDKFKQNNTDVAIFKPNFDLKSFLDEIRISEEKLVRNRLETSFNIFEECVAWFSMLHLWLLDKDELRDIACLTGMACTQIVAIRQLVLSGLDSPARAILRTLFETICISVVLLDNQPLMEVFRKTDNASSFWYSNFARGKLFKHLDDIYRNRNVPDSLIKVFRNWMKEEYSKLSETIHPSFTAAALTTYSKSLENRDKFEVGSWGRATTFSERTLKQSCLIIWYFSQIGFSATLIPNIHKNEKMRHLLNRNDEDYLGVVLGARVVHGLVSKYIK